MIMLCAVRNVLIIINTSQCTRKRMTQERRNAGAQERRDIFKRMAKGAAQAQDLEKVTDYHEEAEVDTSSFQKVLHQ